MPRIWIILTKSCHKPMLISVIMMTSSNGNIFRVTGPLCGEFTGPGEFSAQRPVTRSFDVFFDLRLNKRLNKQSWGWWFETLSRPSWRHRNVLPRAGDHIHDIAQWMNYVLLYPMLLVLLPVATSDEVPLALWKWIDHRGAWSWLWNTKILINFSFLSFHVNAKRQ